MKCFLTLVAILMGGVIMSAQAEIATFGGGCFWCMEPLFENEKGVEKVEPGYMGGALQNPTYQQVSTGTTGHIEVVQITFNPKIISYEKLLEIFFQGHDPTDDGGQFVDRGSQYRSAIFYRNDQQKLIAQNYIKNLEKSHIFKKPIVTELKKSGPFTIAEEYHRDFYKKSPTQYDNYKKNSGREEFLQEVWGKQCSNVDLNKLTPLQLKVTQENGTEEPFNNEYWNEKREGIYVDVVSGEPLFSSTDKFDSGTGWPSFSRPIKKEEIVEKEDTTLLQTRIEVRSKKSNSHLGHLFYDGPTSTKQRFCINSAALRFIPKEKLKEKGYGEYLKIFK